MTHDHDNPDADWLRKHPDRKQSLAACRHTLALQGYVDNQTRDWVASIEPTAVLGHYEIRYRSKQSQPL
jgi:hypothetical protein